MKSQEFKNDPLGIDNLPQYQEVTYQKIAKEKLKVRYLSLAFFYLIVLLVFFTFCYFVEDNDINYTLILGIFSLVVVMSCFYVYYSFKNTFYALREKDIIYKNGVFTLSTSIVPFNRIQNIAIHQGLFSRWYALANLELFTAGGNDIEIKGLYYSDALRIKEFIASVIEEEEVEVENEEEVEENRENISDESEN